MLKISLNFGVAGLLRKSRLLLLNCLVLLTFAELITKALSGNEITKTASSVSEVSLIGRWRLVDYRKAPSISESSLLARIPLIRRELRERFSLQNRTSTLSKYSSLPTVGQPSSDSSELSKLLMQQDQNNAPESSLIPPIVGDNAPTDSNSSSVPGIAIPPDSPHRPGKLKNGLFYTFQMKINLYFDDS